MAPQLRLAAESANYGTLILALTWTEAAIAIVLLAGRFYTSWRITHRLKADFHIALFTFCVAFIGQICLTISVNYGLGAHIDTLGQDRTIKALEYSWVFQVMFVACMALGKLAIIAFLVQIRGPYDPKPWLLYFVAVTQTVVMLITICFITQQCSPMSKLWDNSVPGTCDGVSRNQKFGFFQGAWSALCDLILALYPISIVWRVRLDLHVKVGLCVLMGLGVIAAVCAAIRTAELETLSNTHDVTYFISPLIIWCATETWIIFIVSCVPPIRPLFVQLFKVVSTVTSTSRTRSCSSPQLGKSQLSKAAETTTQSDQVDYQLKPIAQTDGSLGSLEAAEHGYGSLTDIVGNDTVRAGAGVRPLRASEVLVTRNVDVQRSPKIVFVGQSCADGFF